MVPRKSGTTADREEALVTRTELQKKRERRAAARLRKRRLRATLHGERAKRGRSFAFEVE